ncbi:T-cell surface glycoprotein CD8 alpha chain isoform X2 [Lepisosteus oculatus]|uniref:T-cell surface glycoprotein CD8 alpha chain isoform X2 n=1 Tax=Lepisosteus oculatus TaxID=7918 RepID=UPI00371BF374
MLRAAGLVALCSLLLHPKPTCTQEPITGTEGGSVKINCKLSHSGSESTVYWFRVKDKTTDTLVAVNSLGKPKPEGTNSKFTPDKRSGTYTLEIKQFRSAEDTGLYSCAALVNSRLSLGALTKVSAKEQTPTATKAKPTEKTTRPLITNKPCNTSASEVRTRRCPHHYKRRPKKEVNGRPSVPDRYV